MSDAGVMASSTPRYIVVEGPIGIGKTSLARRLAAEFNAELLLEAPTENPFLEAFYANQRQAALSTQLFFLMQRSRQIQALHQQEIFSTGQVADFMIEKDFLFAQATLTPSEFDLYQQVYSHMTIDAPIADLVVYLQAPVEVLMSRIRHRGRGFERAIGAGYLERINEAYAQFFYHYDKSPLLIVNAAEIDFINNDRDYFELLEQIRVARNGRFYFNPLSFAN